MRLIAFITALALVPAVALAAIPKSGGWSGHTRQGKSISFTVKNHKVVKRLKVGFKSDCGGSGMSVDVGVNLGGKYRVVDGRFKATTTDGFVKGTFTTRKKAKGTLKFEQRIFTGFGYETCSSGKVRWTAHR